MYGKFWFEDDFFVRNMDASLELSFFFFFYQGLSYAFDFSMSFSVSKELRILILSSVRRKQTMEITWKTGPKMSGCRENSPSRFAKVQDYDTLLIY